MQPALLIEHAAEVLCFPDFLCDMRSKWIEQDQEGFELFAADGLVVRNVVDQCHQGCDSSVKLHFFDIFADLLDCFMECAFQLVGIFFAVVEDVLQCPIHDQGNVCIP